MWKSIVSATCMLPEVAVYEGPTATEIHTVVPCEPLIRRGQIRVGFRKGFRRGQQNQAAVENIGIGMSTSRRCCRIPIARQVEQAACLAACSPTRCDLH